MSKVKSGHLIQRLIIFNLGLLPGAQSGGVIDEAASDAELCEHILYYNELEEGEKPVTATDARCSYNFEEAIRFAGLCNAYYSIQTTIDNQMNTNRAESNTREVYLSTCTLVFTQLEPSETKGIVAVAQLPRPSKRNKNTKRIDENDVFSPLKMRDRLLKAHDLFQHTNGGICTRLCTQNSKHHDGAQSKTPFESRYIGIDEFYSYHKSLRKLYKIFSNASTKNEKDQVEEKVDLIQRQLNECAQSLPINALRMDLKQFYDSFLRDIAVSEC
eukprot:scaffold4567_cov276-Chaetoceros_neogracile.AAC.33